MLFRAKTTTAHRKANHATTAEAPRGFQFSTATLLWATAVVAVGCWLAEFEELLAAWRILTVLLFLAAFGAVCGGTSRDVAWGLFAIAWAVVLCNTSWLLLTTPDRFSGAVTPATLQEDLLLNYTYGLALPLLVSFPIVYLGLKSSQHDRSHARKWLIGCRFVVASQPKVALSN